MADIDLEATVKTIISTLIARSEPFTALDISNEVKKQAPKVRHREVVPLVRDLYEDGEMGLYERTRIEVSTPNGPEKAYLYHAVGDTWDLDAKYDNQKRAQTATIPQTPVIASQDYGALFGSVVADTMSAASVRSEVAAEEKKNVPIVAGPTLPPEIMREKSKPKQTEELPPSVWSSLFSFMRKKQ